MSDVTALVLTMGEDCTERALASVQRQTYPVAETIVVRGVTPFYRALNAGAARVRTEFFIQVDADMILDDTCVADLRDRAVDGVGIVAGHLRDPMMGTIEAVKLFRTACFAQVRLRESTSPETNFIADILQEGWTILYALKYAGESAPPSRVFGEHRPDYSPYYTFCKYAREGAKARYRKAGGGLRHLFRQLYASGHPSAIIAIIAAAHGIFVRADRDLYGPHEQNEGFEFLERFLKEPPAPQEFRLTEDDLISGDLRATFQRSYQLGLRLRRHQAAQAFLKNLHWLCEKDGVAGWVSLVGLCHGLLIDDERAEFEADFALLRELLPE